MTDRAPALIMTLEYRALCDAAAGPQRVHEWVRRRADKALALVWSLPADQWSAHDHMEVSLLLSELIASIRELHRDASNRPRAESILRAAQRDIRTEAPAHRQRVPDQVLEALRWLESPEV